MQEKLIKKDKKNLSNTITFFLFTYDKSCIKLRIVRKVVMDGNILTFQLFVFFSIL